MIQGGSGVVSSDCENLEFFLHLCLVLTNILPLNVFVTPSWYKHIVSSTPFSWAGMNNIMHTFFPQPISFESRTLNMV